MGPFSSSRVSSPSAWTLGSTSLRPVLATVYQYPSHSPLLSYNILLPRIKSHSPYGRNFSHRTVPNSIHSLHTQSSASSSASSPPPPYIWPTPSNISPYKILHTLPSDARYTKSKSAFSYWVKLYHPDTSTSGDHDPLAAIYSPIKRQFISSAEKARRLALVLAADKLLSDPSKRQLYDLYGIGWENTSKSPDHNSDPGVHTGGGVRGSPIRTSPQSASRSETFRNHYARSTPNWDEFSTEGDGPISRYQARAISIIMGCLTLSGIAFGVHAAFEREERMDAVHRRASHHLIQVQNEAQQRWDRAMKMELERAEFVPHQDEAIDHHSNAETDIVVDRKKVLQRMLDEFKERGRGANR